MKKTAKKENGKRNKKKNINNGDEERLHRKRKRGKLLKNF